MDMKPVQDWYVWRWKGYYKKLTTALTRTLIPRAC